jgi:CheY-like chemotaxis protein
LKTTVLLVEDSKFQKIANERMLQRAGYTVLNAPDGEQALKAAREAVPDIVLLDMLLPKLGGREVMLALRADPSTARIPVLFLSSLSQANESKLTEEGAASYFAKSRLAERPAAAEKELIQLIDKLVQSARAASAKPGPLKAAARTT